MIGIDSNILIYAHNSGSPLYEESKQLIHKAVQEDGLGISELSLREFYAVITDGRKVERPFLPATASALLKNYIQSSKVSVCKLTEEVWLRAFEYCDQHDVARYHLDDLLIAMSLCLNGVETVYTRNIRDFEQFEFIQAINPFRSSPIPSAPCTLRMIPYSRQSINEQDVAAVCKTLRSDWLTQGPTVPAFEEAVAKYCGAKYAIAVSNGTAALHIAVTASGMKEGEEGITSPNTFLASANCIAFCKGTPRFADIFPDTYCIDPSEVLKAISPQTRLLIPVHFAGQPCEMEAIWNIAKQNGLFVIEDAAHAIGASWKDSQGKMRRVGDCSHSDLTIFSFHPVKTITTGEGGMILTNDEYLANKCRLLRNHGITRDKSHFLNQPSAISNQLVYPPFYYEMHELGYNYRITDIQSALGLSQMEHLDKFITRRREIWSCYNEELDGIEGFQTPIEREDVQSAWHLYAAQTDHQNELISFLHENGVGAHAMYIPVHMQPYYQEHFKYREGDFPRSEAYFKKAIILPLYPSLTETQIQYITTQVKRFYQHGFAQNAV